MKVYRADSSLAFTGALIFGICGIVFILVSISEGTFYNALWVHGIYFSLVVMYYIGAKYGVFVIVSPTKIKGYAFFIPGVSTEPKNIIALEEVATFGGQVTHIQMIVSEKKLKKRGLISKETISAKGLNDLISELQKINPKIIVPPSLLK
ncbi:MAG: hypothetical protein MUF19_03600 [Candidatus Pacebacteria bacterium]|jgi:hypothetical protein|nr:hypothetical protein [Candidatus Paceibacterota bacterium]